MKASAKCISVNVNTFTFKQHVKVNLSSDDPINKCHITIFDKIYQFMQIFVIFGGGGGGISKSTIFLSKICLFYVIFNIYITSVKKEK